MKHDKVQRGLRTRIRTLWPVGFRALDNWIFGEIDAFAWVQGWEIDRSRLATRRYRSPLFDTLQRCGLCRGVGLTGQNGHVCGLCEGDGRIARLNAGASREK
ncbi:hypothetical protein ACLQ2R_18715 [Streptosporangium sp. DT93]|uniref:hypothetical protein n=1 Tax=Streptosporangium sp. DT93 TaxID=3393428 RepID=UPI003CF06F31